MKTMLLEKCAPLGSTPLRLADLPVPEPGPGQVLIRVRACGVCACCRSGRENLCDQGLFTGYDLDGGLAEYTVQDEAWIYSAPEGYPDLQAAPLLCAGVIKMD